MHKAINQMERLNRISIDILAELEEKSLSLESLNLAMEKRQESVDRLSDLAGELKGVQLSKKDSERIDIQLDNFQRLNLKILKTLDDILNNRREEIASTMQQQKAVKSYTISEKPDISYLKQV
jgi:hypothetical protein